MKKNNLFIALIAMLFLTGCQGTDINLDAPVGENPFVEASPVADQPISQNVSAATPKATLTPTQAGTPTPSDAEKLGRAQLDLQYSLGTATMRVAYDNMTEQSVIKTSTVLQSYVNGTATATVAIGDKKATRTAALTQTLMAQAMETESASATGTVQAPLTQKAQVEADWEPFWQAVLLCGAILLFLVVAYYGLRIGYQLERLAYEKRLALHQEQSGETDQPEEQPATTTAAVNIKLDQRDKYGYGAVNMAMLPISKETLRDVAELLLSGARYTEAQMTGAGRPLIKDKTFDSFGDFMCKYYIAAKIDRRYTILHMEFFEQVLKK